MENSGSYTTIFLRNHQQQNLALTSNCHLRTANGWEKENNVAKPIFYIFSALAAVEVEPLARIISQSTIEQVLKDVIDSKMGADPDVPATASELRPLPSMINVHSIASHILPGPKDGKVAMASIVSNNSEFKLHTSNANTILIGILALY